MLKEQLRDTEKRLSNLLEAIEQGILTSTTKQRLDELEARRDALKASILEEELQRPALSRDQILFWFEQFRQGDVNSPVYQRQIIDNFVNSVYVFEDRVVLNFNFKENAKNKNPRPQAPGFCFARASQRRPRFESCTAAQPSRVPRTKQARHNESEARPVDETAELELGQLSKFTNPLRRVMEIWLTATKGAAV